MATWYLRGGRVMVGRVAAAPVVGIGSLGRGSRFRRVWPTDRSDVRSSGEVG
jgi:hypothetical protein